MKNCIINVATFGLFLCGNAMGQQAVIDLPQKGSVTYQGTYDGSSISRSARNAKSKEMSGAMTIFMTFDGPEVIATIKPTGTMSAFKVSGSRLDGVCKLFNRTGDSFSGNCNTSFFNGSLISSDTSRVMFRVDFETDVKDFVDEFERKRLASEKKAKVDREREIQVKNQEAKEAEELARQEAILNSLPPVKKK